MKLSSLTSVAKVPVLNWQASSFCESVRSLLAWNRVTLGTRRKRRCFPLTLEGYEQRVMLDGNVSAIIAEGNLNITGDSAGNSVEILVADGNVVVRGLNNTTVNGSTEDFIAVTGGTQVAGDVSIQLAKGSDLAVIHNGVEVTGNVRFEDYRGTNQLAVIDATIGGNLSFKTGKGADALDVRNSTIGGWLWVQSARGSDVISVLNTTVSGETHILTDHGRDDIQLEDSQFQNLTVWSGDTQDDLIIRDTTINGNLIAHTGSGSDIVMFSGATVMGTTTITTGQGADIVVTEGTNTFTGHFFAASVIGTKDTIDRSAETTFAGGQTVIGFERTVASQSILDGRLTSNPNGAETRVQAVQDDFSTLVTGELTLTASLTEDPLTTTSVGTEVTKLETVSIEGETLAGATIEVDADGDGLFDDAMTTVGDDGSYTVDVPLDAGQQIVSVRVTDLLDRTLTAEDINVYRAVGSVVRMDSTLGFYDVELLDEEAPITVANFKNYFERFTNSIIHRAPANFVIQGGGFALENGEIVEIETDDPIENEFNAANSNVRGTLSMALRGDDPVTGIAGEDSGTSGWFINTVNNSGLDDNLHTVFGRVIGDGMDVVDAIQAVPLFNLNPFQAQATGAFATIPLRNYEELTQQLTGTVSVDALDIIVKGTDTLFTQELEVGDRIAIRAETFFVSAINSDTELELDSEHQIGETDGNAFTNATPTADNLVVYSSIDEILTA